MGRSRAEAKLNFIGTKNKSRLSFGPQIPERILWKIVSKIEEFIGWTGRKLTGVKNNCACKKQYSFIKTYLISIINHEVF